MQPDDSGKEPEVVLSYLLGRKLNAGEVYEAFGLSKSTYYDQLAEGKLITADKLIRAARHLGINEADLLVRYGLLSVDAIEEYAEQLGKARAPRGKAPKTKIEISPRKDRDAL